METINGVNCISEQHFMCQVTKPVNTRGVLMERPIPSYYSGLSVAPDNDLLRVFQGFWMCNFLTSPLLRGLAQYSTNRLRKASQKPLHRFWGEKLGAAAGESSDFRDKGVSGSWARESWIRRTQTYRIRVPKGWKGSLKGSVHVDQQGWSQSLPRANLGEVQRKTTRNRGGHMPLLPEARLGCGRGWGGGQWSAPGPHLISY